VWYEHKNKIFTHNLPWMELQFSDFCCDSCPDGKDVQAGLTDRIIYQRHVGGLLVFPVGGLGFNLQNNMFGALLRTHVTLILIFQADLMSGCICAPWRVLLSCTCFTDVTCATVTRDAVHTLLCLLGISNRYSFLQCPTECMFSFENGPDIGTVCPRCL
jgi:hypothetical protein